MLRCPERRWHRSAYGHLRCGTNRYASDTGGAIKGQRIDLFTGVGAASMKALQNLNMTTISAIKVGMFEGCPTAKTPVMVASNN